ncbi:hypothetical protein KI387_043890 [Taxus chinensis]|uniref:Reverse transcriptase domain-containing protein n=1 Tax=Taxus chinensis TaxID=29808 RepID=A0AA38CV77_TAXCH|nr:hypothetical protein KI387_043890 [Taxus chinensis]
MINPLSSGSESTILDHVGNDAATLDYLNAYAALHLSYHTLDLSLIPHSSSYFGNPVTDLPSQKEPNIYAVENGDDLDLPPAPPEFEEGNASLIEETIDVNIGTEDEPRILKLRSLLTPEEVEIHTQVLKEHQKAFAFNYKEMTGVTPHIAVGFIKSVDYSQWVSNIVPVLKKNGKIRICIDFRDINKACPKDDFPLPSINVIVDATAGFELLSLMDGFSGYNQIRISEQDQAKTTFITPWGTYCYAAMPFGLKNAGATYQQAMTYIFHDLIHKIVESYVDDLLAKAKKRCDHPEVLRIILSRLIEYGVTLNPEKCVFGVTGGKLLGYIISSRGIDVDPTKIWAVLEMVPPSSESGIRSFLGKLGAIRRFIPDLSFVIHPINNLLKKDYSIDWTEDCNEAFDAVNHFLLSPPTLMPPKLDRPLILYSRATNVSLACMLAQEDNDKRERAIYFIRRTLLDYETRYTQAE